MKKQGFVLIMTLLAGAAVGYLLCYLFTGDPAPTGVSQKDYDAMKGVYENAIADNLGITSFADSLQWESRKKDSAIKVYIIETNKYRLRLADSSERIKGLALQVLQLNSGGEKDARCDSLANQVLLLISQYSYISERYDYLTNYVDSSSVFHQVIVDELKKANSKLLDQYNALYSSYISLLADQTTLRHNLKRQKLKTKMAAVLGIIGTGAALFK